MMISMASILLYTSVYKSICKLSLPAYVKENNSSTQQMDMTEKRKLFESIVPQYSEKLYWAIRRIVLCHDDANDVLQNVFIKVWNGIDDFQNRSKLSTWLYRIAVNEALDFLRRKRNVASLDISDNISVADRLEADQYFDGDRAQALLQEAIASLPDVQRVVFNLRYYDEMKYSEISQLLDTSEGALKASYHIAVKKITAFMKEHQ